MQLAEHKTSAATALAVTLKGKTSYLNEKAA